MVVDPDTILTTDPSTDNANTPVPKPLYTVGAGGSSRTVGRPPCRFFASGSCAAGDLCPFQHVATVGPAVAAQPSSIVSAQSVQPTSTSSSSSSTSSTASPQPPNNEQTSPPTGRLSYSQLAGMGAKPTSGKTVVSQVNPQESAVVMSSPPQQILASKEELCVFAVTGKCRFGPVCRNVHGLQCPRCLLYCLHPYDLEQNEEHIQECLERPVRATSATAEDESIECGICLERVLSKPDPRFGLLNCEHSFCLGCIRQWRSSCSTGNLDPTTVRSCPLCRVVTYFIVPSSQFVRDGEEKAKVIEAYKRKLQAIPCRHFDMGRGKCPFGSSCFYSHILPDGAVTGDNGGSAVRSYVDANEQVKVVREFRLSDFLPGS